MATVKLRVKRTSTGYRNRDASPCDGAVMVAPADDIQSAVWEIDIADLDALMAFAVKYGSIIIAPPTAQETPDDSPYFDVDAHWRLEIYDGYRE